MKWEDIGIADPKIAWSGSDGKSGFDFIGLLEKTVDEIGFYEYEIEDLYMFGLWSDTISQFRIWLDFIEHLLNESIDGTNSKAKLLKARNEIVKFRYDFEDFAIKIGWYGDEL